MIDFAISVGETCGEITESVTQAAAEKKEKRMGEMLYHNNEGKIYKL